LISLQTGSSVIHSRQSVCLYLAINVFILQRRYGPMLHVKWQSLSFITNGHATTATDKSRSCSCYVNLGPNSTTSTRCVGQQDVVQQCCVFAVVQHVVQQIHSKSK